MPRNWQDFFNNRIGILLAEELKSFVNDAKQDTDAFIKRQGEKLELYLTQLAEGKITKREFEGYIIDIRDLTRLQARKMRVRAKARAQRLVKNIQRLILDSLLRLI